MDKIPNGGFPLIKYCENLNENTKTEKNKIDKKQYFYSSKNNVNIRNILKKNNKNFIDNQENNDTILEEINEI